MKLHQIALVKDIGTVNSRNDHYKVVDLRFLEKNQVKNYPLIDLLKFGCKKVKLVMNLRFNMMKDLVIFTSKVLLQT